MDYTFDKNTYFAKLKENPKDLMEKEIGDSKTPSEFLPQQKIMRWDNECNVSIRLKHDEKTPTVSQEGDKIKWKGKDIEAHFYDINNTDHPEGASEFEVILNEKPKSNVVEFTVVDKDVDYFYQPALTPEEIEQGSQRPDNVVGSYAVYAKTPKTNWTGGKEYKVGKIGHIFRPKIIDSAGTEVWGDLHIENGILSVTIPQDFLDKAIYPVRHAAGLTFGYTNVGASSGNSTGNTYIMAAIGTSGADAGTASSISVAMWDTAAADHLKSALYTYSGTTATLVANSSTGAIAITRTTKPTSDPATWTTGNITATIGASTVYYISCMYRVGGTTSYKAYDSTNHGFFFGGKAYASFPYSSFTASDTTYAISAYATYTASGGGGDSWSVVLV
jgi:hypothetical protein